LQLLCGVGICAKRRRVVVASPRALSRRRRTHLETWLDLELHARFAGRILPINAQVADRWGLLTAGAKRPGKTLATIDGLLAATALHRNLTVVSLKVSDFANVPVRLLNPWKV
jgi:predicted nucleic acid-binding protein